MPELWQGLSSYCQETGNRLAVRPNGCESLIACKINVSQIRDIFPDEPLVEEFAEGSWDVQHLAPEELRVISMPAYTDKSLAYYPNYVYPSKSRQEVFIYHAELGINVQHQEFSGRRIEWVYTPRAVSRGEDKEEESPLGRKPGHSTCTASKATGNTFGADKFATLVVVKMPDLRPSSVAEVFATISDHIRVKRRQYSSFVTVSWGSKKPLTYVWTQNAHWRRLKEDISELSDLGTKIIFAAGNAANKQTAQGGSRSVVDTFPAVTGNYQQRFVASNCDNQGRRYPTSQVYLLSLLSVSRRTNHTSRQVSMCNAHAMTRIGRAGGRLALLFVSSSVLNVLAFIRC